ncbi:MAG: hypothetical protein A2722_00290 [Candidatus Doudnabacteria bacterium RIFCSPHIGHO2_01_FULL_50_11]|uniref:Uncharacterized protein n=1 Tax=Candidatus Doudnabacteria bacterium RIFCSPHIGHO2_01_FULL_50_11 TaxID=1817828 RepID=A0A1F5PI07_9BACT|nr:MAG: hypothetical protein A2722_00290 [Candidatus Doudnabacteria bacterium RIFCSPHIGHO2_01_FULL_50_11]HLC44916.1 hypothetical protein [Patescibacteria group bacterium]
MHDNDRLSGTPIFRRAAGYVTKTVYSINDLGELEETLSALHGEGHEHEVSRQKVSRGREKHVLQLHREHLKAIEQHQKLIEQQLVELQQRKEELTKQWEGMLQDTKVLEARNPDAKDKEATTNATN